ncbi:PQQ-binding-like beta-propeller repeat protein [Actinoplanes sp. TBRC 11911]|uniref:outer membrane protein assembly factor BamB family protein n=1 Tax=Actinoplanes sp. TBRC 11911 TaxID=2729386 RepID=UPI00145F4477|nr:PQQ-binding-like beta-propeller repeat protein [Actinoplanes sp. TBRC 11911]NMO52554.1 PQQ-binding-like beta-propeller repeat protein [Actinoplanes sp. TBRC 11911]
MPTNLDQLFERLGQQADAIPLATAEQARDHGRRRTRRQAMISAALAVCLVAVGVGATLYRPRHGPGQTAGPASTRPLPEVGSPFRFGAEARQALSTIAGPRAFTGWQTGDGTIRVTAADLHTGKPAWATRTVGRFDDLARVYALPQALLVSVVPDRDAIPLNDYNPDTTTYVYDPATGKLRWKYASGASDDEVFHDRVLVQTSAKTGATTAYDWVTGAVRWTLPGGSDRTVSTLGMGTADNSMQASFTDDRLIRVLKSGQVQVRNITTGAPLLTAKIPAPGPASVFVAYDGQLFDAGRTGDATTPFRVEGTKLTGDGGDPSSGLLVLPAGREVQSMWQCGSGRLCLLDTDGSASSSVVALDFAQRRTLWRADVGIGGADGYFRHGTTVVGGSQLLVLDQNGKKVLSLQSGGLEWLSDDALLATPGTGAGVATRVHLPDGRQTVLGTLPAQQNPCRNNADRLVCPSDTDVRIFSLSG